MGFPGGTSGKEPACQRRRHRDVGSIPGSGWYRGGGNDNPLQYSRLENSMDRRAWQATVHRVAKSQTHLKRLGATAAMYRREVETETFIQQKETPLHYRLPWLYLKFLGGNVCLVFKLFFPGETHSTPSAFSLILPVVLYRSYFSDESTDLGSLELLFSQRFTASEWMELDLSPCPLGKVTIPDCEG